MGAELGFQEKTGKVIVVDASGATRAMLTEVIRSLGFKDVAGVPAIKDALSILEVEPVKWFILPLMADQSENALHILTIVTQNPHLSDVRLSILVEDQEQYCLPAAFEKGLMSWHPKPFTKDSIRNDLQNLMKVMEECGWNSTLTAARYLRDFLVFSNKFQELLSFEKSLVELFPNQIELLINLIQPLAKLDRKHEARIMLRRVMLIENTLEAKVKEAAQKFLEGDYQTGAQDGEAATMLDLNQVVIVDSDEAVLKIIREVVDELGPKEIQTFNDGEAAVSFIAEHPDPSLIVSEWRLPKLPGPLFVQRAKSRGGTATPMVIVSSLIQKEDIPFVREMGVAATATKPVARTDLLRTLIKTILQDRSPTDQYQMERKIKEYISSKRLSEAKELLKNYLTSPQVPVGMKKTMEAEMAFAEHEYEKARDLGIEAIKANGDSLSVLNLLGKTLMHLKDFPAACRCFEKAQSLSPLNIERLCHLAEVHSEMGDGAKAEEALEKAKSVDEQNVQVKETEAKVALNIGQIEKARAIMKQLDSMNNVVAYMNNQAVSWARAGMVNRGIEQYHKTISALPAERLDMISIVNYNLALAQVRGDRLEESLIYLDKAMKVSESKVATKAKSLHNRIKKALDAGQRFSLKGDATEQQMNTESEKKGEAEAPQTGEKSPSAKDLNGVVANILAAKGEIGCYLLYLPLEVDARAMALFNNPPRFSVRRAIERSEAMGAEKLLKASGS